MKKFISLFLATMLILSIATTAFAYPAAEDVKDLPYSSSFRIKQSTTTKYCFIPSSGTLSISLSGITMDNSKDATLKVTPCYYISSSGKWGAGTTQKVSVTDGSASDTTLDCSVVSGRKYCVKFAKTDYTSLYISASFSIN